MRLLRSNGADHIRLGVGRALRHHVRTVFVSTTGYDDEGWGSQWDEDPEGESVLGVLERVTGLTGEVAENVVELLGDMWFDRNTMAHQYGTDPHFVENEKFDEPLSQAWQDMEQSLKYEVRYNNPKVLTLLEQVFGPILDDRIEGRKGVIVEIAPAGRSARCTGRGCFHHSSRWKRR